MTPAQPFALRPVGFSSLDVTITVAYRVNASRGTQIRRQPLIRGLNSLQRGISLN